MAHFKRKRSRTQTYKTLRGSPTSWRAKHALKPVRLTHGLDGNWYGADWGRARGLSMMNSEPNWHDIAFHRRPHRRRTQRLLDAVLKGRLDPDDIAWPLYGKPRIWYW